MARPELDSLTARRFRTGRPSLDFTHTGGVGRFLAAELVHDAGDLRYWLAYLLDLPAVTAAEPDVEPARRLRAAVWALAQARVRGRALPRGQVRTVNLFAAAPPPRIALASNESVRTERPDAPAALSMLARDAIDLLGGPLGHRIRECAAVDCGLLFVDSSPPSSRRWCSMQRCGNRAKAVSHRGRVGRA
jgi:predicted RNA-binding Zn ribbon-like protein